jgi:hypothetical protein
MTGSDGEFDDHDLRARFAELRRAEAERAPEWLWPLAGGGGRKRRWLVARVVAVAVCVVVVLGAGWWLRMVLPHPRTETNGTVASIAEWKSPTDFLLETPGRNLLQTVPAIGQWGGYTAAKPERKHGRVKTRALP